MKKTYKLIALIMAVLIICPLIPTAAYAKDEGDSDMKLGLIVAEDGTLMLGGKPFYAFGENNYGTFARWTEGDDKDWFREAIPLFKEYNIPFIRCPFSGYSPDYYTAFDASPSKYLQMMDEVVKCAEENQLGLIVSLAWLEIAIPTHVGEKRSAFGDPNSKTIQYSKYYVSKIVERFKDSPAVWGWEIGNEYNLGADLCDPSLKNWAPTYFTVGEVNGFDYYTSTELNCYYSEIAKTIREIDPDRMISNGNGEMRSFAYASYINSTQHINQENHTWEVDWTCNSRDEFYFMSEFLTPDPMDTLSFHFQHATLGSSTPSYILTFNPLRDEGIMDLTGYLSLYADACKNMKKACYFGEFGDMLDMNNAPDRAEKFQYVMDCIKEAGIQLASAWHYQDVTTEGLHGENLTMIGEMNTLYQQEGKQDLASYWDNATYKFVSSGESEDQPSSSENSSTEETNGTSDNSTDSEEKTSSKAGLIAGIAGGAIAVAAAAGIIVAVKKKKK